jgi:hypothetical protein
MPNEIGQLGSRLATLWADGKEAEVIKQLSSFEFDLEAVALGALIAIYLESEGAVEPVGEPLARFNCELARLTQNMTSI